MVHLVVYGHAAALRPRIPELSDALHAAAVEAFRLPPDKRFHRFVPLEPDCFYVPADRSRDYTVVEVSLFTGRSVESKKAFIRAVYARTAGLGLRSADVEITLTETPRENWGIRGRPADELDLSYRVDV